MDGVTSQALRAIGAPMLSSVMCSRLLRAATSTRAVGSAECQRSVALAPSATPIGKTPNNAPDRAQAVASGPDRPASCGASLRVARAEDSAVLRFGSLPSVVLFPIATGRDDSKSTLAATSLTRNQSRLYDM